MFHRVLENPKKISVSDILIGSPENIVSIIPEDIAGAHTFIGTQMIYIASMTVYSLCLGRCPRVGDHMFSVGPRSFQHPG